MPSTRLSTIFLGFVLSYCSGGVLMGSAADELRERAAGMRKKSAALAEQGNKEQARLLERESVELLEAAERLEAKTKGGGEKGVGEKVRKVKGDRPEIDKEATELGKRLGDLLAAERRMRESKASEQELATVHKQISGVEQELAQLKAQRVERGEEHAESSHFAKLEAANRRIHHLRVAAENLKLAEVHDLPGQLLEKADAMKREVHGAQQRLSLEAKEGQAKRAVEVVRDLKAEIERLRVEVEELHRKK